MVKGARNILGVFISLVYTQAMPNKHYCSTYMMSYHYYISIHLINGKFGRFMVFSCIFMMHLDDIVQVYHFK